MKIIYFMGKSASGKDTIYRKVKEKLKSFTKGNHIVYDETYTRSRRKWKRIFLCDRQ